MNRILFDSEELHEERVTFGGVRAEHVLTVLHGEVGQTLKTGEVNGLVGTSVIEAIDRTASSGPLITVRYSHETVSLSPWVDLVLAPPRPRVMKRLLPQLASLGVGRIFLVGAQKVEKDFWGATLLKEENYRPLLVDGLMQAGTTALPTLETRRNFRKFVREELDVLFPDSTRIVAHPYGASKSSSHIPHPSSLLLAIGPEGGWTDEEVVLLEAHGFTRYSLGTRILRTDTATVALLAQLMQVYDR